jgi:hypothetical protein
MGTGRKSASVMRRTVMKSSNAIPDLPIRAGETRLVRALEASSAAAQDAPRHARRTRRRFGRGPIVLRDQGFRLFRVR